VAFDPKLAPLLSKLALPLEVQQYILLMKLCVGVFYRQIFGSWRNSLGAKSKHSRDTRFILVRAPGKRVTALRPAATCLYCDLVEMAR
jgi:hypothetical protein